MQILLGAHETIIKINSKSIRIDYIQHFISTHFTSRTIEDNIIKIPESKENIYHRTFLLKWIYSLYSKKNRAFPELKESLLKRYEKRIKIVLPRKIVHKLHYKIVDCETMQLTIIPNNSVIAYKVKTFLQVKMTILPTHLQMTFHLQEEKERLRAFLSSKIMLDVAYEHLYNKKEMELFLQEKKQKEKVTPLQSAYMLLGVRPTDSVKNIKKRYKILAKKSHPDLILTDDRRVVALQTKKFQELLEAYETILQYPHP